MTSVILPQQQITGFWSDQQRGQAVLGWKEKVTGAIEKSPLFRNGYANDRCHWERVQHECKLKRSAAILKLWMDQ